LNNTHEFRQISLKRYLGLEIILPFSILTLKDFQEKVRRKLCSNYIWGQVRDSRESFGNIFVCFIFAVVELPLSRFVSKKLLRNCPTCCWFRFARKKFNVFGLSTSDVVHLVVSYIMKFKVLQNVQTINILLNRVFFTTNNLKQKKYLILASSFYLSKALLSSSSIQ
jgi:hypothetical protein